MPVDIDMCVESVDRISTGFGLLKLTAVKGELPKDILPGQFVQADIPDSKKTFLRRPISVCNVENGKLWLLVRIAGEGTRHLVESAPGDLFNIILPLGKGFSIDSHPSRALLVGGGVGTAPLLFLGKTLAASGCDVNFLIGARTKSALVIINELIKYGKVFVSTDDGSAGSPGTVMDNPALRRPYDMIYSCGPTPMMKALAAYAKAANVECEVSLENLMACGLGACLCCVEDTTDSGNVCVCKEGPVFNINRLKWNL